MHEALLIDEIILAVARWLTDRSDWLAMAMTCTAFREPALALLWADLDNIRPLVALLVRPLNTDTSSTSLEGLPSPFEGIARNVHLNWDRWHVYEAYVREIGSVKIEDIDPSILETTKLDGLLPNLRGATITSGSRPSLRYLLPLTRLVGGPQLCSLAYGLTRTTSSETELCSLESLLSFLITQSFPITTLDMRNVQLCVYDGVMNEAIAIRHMMVKFIHTLQNLHQLTIYNILDVPFMLLNEIAQLPHLRVLHTDVWRPKKIERTSDIQVVLPDKSFASLEKLFIETHAVLWRQLDALLLPPASRLQTLSIKYYWSVSDGLPPGLPTTLQTLTSLEVLLMNICGEDSHSSSPWTLQESRFFSIIVSLSHLRIVSISLTWVRGPTRELIQQFALGWPKLESLTLTFRDGFSSSSSRYSVEDLLHFVHHCHNLTFLHIPMFQTPVSVIENIPSGVAPRVEKALFHNLRPASVEDVNRASSFIRGFWPNASVEFPFNLSEPDD